MYSGSIRHDVTIIIKCWKHSNQGMTIILKVSFDLMLLFVVVLLLAASSFGTHGYNVYSTAKMHDSKLQIGLTVHDFRLYN